MEKQGEIKKNIFGLSIKNDNRGQYLNKNQTFVQKMKRRDSNSDSLSDSDMDEESYVNKNILKQQELNADKVREEISKQLLENSNIYEYDNLFNKISSNNKINKKLDEKDHNSSNFNKPKYLDAILAATERRNIERSIIKEKMEAKRRGRELGSEYEDKPKFITKSYEQKLSINKLHEKQILMQDISDEKNAINSESGMMGFYSGLLTKNSAYAGGRREDNNNKNKSLNRDLKNNLESTKLRESINSKKIETNAHIPLKIKTHCENSDYKIKEPLQLHDNLKNSSQEKNSKISVEDYKNRYLDRKRNRTEKTN